MHFALTKEVREGMTHFSVGQNDLTSTIPVYRNKMNVLHAILTQLSLREGLKWFGKQGKVGALKEMRQLHDMRTFFP